MQVDPARLAKLNKSIEEYRRRVNREKQSKRGGLIEFVKYFWHVLEPNTPFIDGWAIRAICIHLEAITFGEINRLLVVVPPGFCKSLITDVFWPAWEWSAMGRAGTRYVAFSYASSLTERDNGKFRDLMLSQDFKEMYGDVFELQKIGETKVSNNKTGWKLASSVGGVGTGERGNRVILDDPHSIKQAESAPIRTETVRWFREAMSNRLNDMSSDAIVVIMQRSHFMDCAGSIIDENMKYCILSIEMEYDSMKQTAGMDNEIGWADPRSEEGELAWEERFPRDVCYNLKNDIGIYAWAAQYQQRPSPREGGILQRSWWRTWDAEEASKYGLEWHDENGRLKEFPDFELIVGSIDTAYGEKQENNYSAFTAWGLWIDRLKNRRSMLVYAWRKKLPLHGSEVDYREGEAKVNYEQRKKAAWGLVEWIASDCKRFKVKRLLIENKTRGHDIANELVRLYARENWGIQMINPCKDKVSRAHSVVPLFTDGAVWAPDISWADMVITECAEFPKSANDDAVDTVTQFLNWARENELLIRCDEMSGLLEDAAAYQPQTESVSSHYGV